MSDIMNPITMLHEILYIKRLPPPEYDFIPDIYCSWHCRGKVDEDISVIASAPNKKLAKYRCSVELLKVLQSHKKFLSVRCVPNPTTSQYSNIATTGPSFNAVGQLNEICSQRPIGHPVYTDQGILGAKFIIECKLSFYTTQGMASTKKRAKQIAANEMLSRIQASFVDNCTSKENSKLKLQEVTNLYTKLTTRNEEGLRRHSSPDRADEHTFGNFDTSNASEEDVIERLMQTNILVSKAFLHIPTHAKK